jgi:hypothetical protein
MKNDPADLEPSSEDEAAHVERLVLANRRVILAVMQDRHSGVIIPACVGAAAALAVDTLPVEQVEGMVEELCRLLRERALGRMGLRSAVRPRAGPRAPAGRRGLTALAPARPTEHLPLEALAARAAEPEPRGGDGGRAGDARVADVRDAASRALPGGPFCSCRAGFPW